MKINLSKEKMKTRFLTYLWKIFCLPEITGVIVKDVFISRETLETATQAFEASYHDAFSDIDMSLIVCLPADGTITPETYMKRIARLGVTEDTALGWMFVPKNAMYRIVFRNGMRYDLGFQFEYADDAVLSLRDLEKDSIVLNLYDPQEKEYTVSDPGSPPAPYKDNEHWPLENINRFWFIQIQALGKLYRKDHLISAHLANMNCNDTLVMQMVIRDLIIGTNFHRYGYAEDLEYTKDLEKMPYRHEDSVFCQIADRLYAAALTYDRLVRYFYPFSRDRSPVFFAIWECYEDSVIKESQPA